MRSEPTGVARPVSEITAGGEPPQADDAMRASVDAHLDEDARALLSNVGWHLVANHPTFD